MQMKLIAFLIFLVTIQGCSEGLPWQKKTEEQPMIILLQIPSPPGTTQSASGASQTDTHSKFVSSWEELTQQVSINVAGTLPGAQPGTTKLTLRFSNTQSSSIILRGLNDRGIIRILDRDGYAPRMIEGPWDILIPKQGSQDISFVFQGNLTSLSKIRIFQQELELKNG